MQKNSSHKQSDLQTPCENCLKVLGTAKIFKFPCQKPSLHNVVPFRPGNSRAGEKQSTFPQLQWSYSERERITYICQDFTFGSSRLVPSMPVRCRRFVHRPSDVLVEPYEASDGEIIFVQSPPFACVLLPPTRFRSLLIHSDIFSRSISTLQKCEEYLRPI